jgi:predicted metal-dependent hydrolase
VTSDAAFERGLELIRRGEFFAAHEELELAWRASAPAERDFYQGLVHVAVAWYQAGRGNRTGCERQLAKAERRLAPFAPEHRGVGVAGVLEQVRAAAGVVAGGSLALPPLDVPEADALEKAIQDNLEPPVAVEEEEHAETD